MDILAVEVVGMEEATAIKSSSLLELMGQELVLLLPVAGEIKLQLPLLILVDTLVVMPKLEATALNQVEELHQLPIHQVKTKYATSTNLFNMKNKLKGNVNIIGSSSAGYSAYGDQSYGGGGYDNTGSSGYGGSGSYGGINYWILKLSPFM